MARRSPTAEATRQNFIDAFCAVYKTKPVEKITVAEPARKAGYNRGTFYEYFVDVSDLFEQIEDELIEFIGKRVTDTIASGQFADIVPVAFTGLQEQAGKYVFVLLTSEHGSTFPVKLKRALMPVITGRS